MSTQMLLPKDSHQARRVAGMLAHAADGQDGQGIPWAPRCFFQKTVTNKGGFWHASTSSRWAAWSGHDMSTMMLFQKTVTN